MVAFRNPNRFDVTLRLPEPDGVLVVGPSEAVDVSDAGAALVRSRGYLVVEAAEMPAPLPEPEPAPSQTSRGRRAAKDS